MPDRSISRLPKYRHYKPKNLAVVRIDGKDHYLGRYDSPESHENYRRVLAEWLAKGRTDREVPEQQADTDSGLTINELILAYVKFVDGYYVKDGRPTVEPTNVRLVMRLLRQLYGRSPVSSFGPLALKAVRNEMIRAGDCRTEINRRVGRIVRMFKWGVSEELVHPFVYESLRTVSGLRKGRSGAGESAGQARVGRDGDGHQTVRQPAGLGYDQAPATYRDEARRGRAHANRCAWAR